MLGRSKTSGRGVAATLIAMGMLSVPILAAAAGAQTSATVPGGTIVNCNVTTYRLLFWPHGHGKLKSQGFPAYPTPHIELYTGTGTKYPESQSLDFVDAAGQNSQAKSCVNAPVTGPGGGPIPAANVKSVNWNTAVACTAPAGSLVLTAPIPAKAQINVVITTQTVAAAVVTNAGGELQYDSTMCKPQKVPK